METCRRRAGTSIRGMTGRGLDQANVSLLLFTPPGKQPRSRTGFYQIPIVGMTAEPVQSVKTFGRNAAHGGPFFLGQLTVGFAERRVIAIDFLEESLLFRMLDCGKY